MQYRQLNGKAEPEVVRAIKELYDNVASLQGDKTTLKAAVEALPGKIPAAAPTLAAQGLNISFNQPFQISSGNGSPEGIVVGNVGDLYLRQDGGANTVLYIKESGAGVRVGWIAK